MRNITADQAKSFWEDLQRNLFPDNPDFEGKCTHGIMSTEHIAEHMGIDPETTENYLRTCLKVNLSDRSCGRWVV